MSRDASNLINRRAALSILGAGAWATGRAAAAPADELHFSALDHVQIVAPDCAKSAAFYARLFGNPVWKNNKAARRYVKLGTGSPAPAYLAIDEGPARTDHVSAGIQGFQIANIHSYLEQRGIAYRDFPSGRDLSVTDPDGIRLELSAENTWSQLETGTASPEPAPAAGEPIFRATGLDHILLNVSDPEKSAVFYAKIYGPVSQRNNNRIWFQIGKSRIGLLQTPAGQKPGVNHFCVAAAAFDYDSATKKLQQAGIKPEPPEVAGAPEFHDPDGFLVQVMAPRTAAKQ
jgi:catechol 2,3-dioxygenase-like lactoylglutathione lyase family enzyme